jgi:hypothetical protein
MRHLLRIAFASVAVGLLAGCSHTPLQEQPPQHGEIAPGPGVFSGADGSFTIVGDSKRKKRY